MELITDPSELYRTLNSISMEVFRHTRLTKAFSKKVQNHAAEYALYMKLWNFDFAGPFRITPAFMEFSTLYSFKVRGCSARRRLASFKSTRKLYPCL
jgi:hypothetical protein